jgi:colanic acid biosynthesis glycosyl transferase WcaI
MSGKALLISPFFYPELISTGRYNTHLSRALVEAGFALDVIAFHPLYPEWQPSPSNKQMPGVRILRGGAGIRYPKSPVLRRLVLELLFTWHVFRTCMAEKDGYDLTLYIFPPVLFSLIPRAIFKTSLRVGIIHDLQGIMANARRGAIRKMVSQITRILERKAFERCDLLVCLSTSMRNVVVDNYRVPVSKTFISYPFPSIAGGSTDDLTGILDSGHIHVVYSGALGEKQQPELLLAVYKAICEADEKAVCHFFSRGPLFEKLVAESSGLSMSRIRFHDLVSDANLAELYQRSTVQLIPQATGTGSGAFPSKLPNLLAMEVPVFAICDLDSELAQIIRESGCGRAVDSQDPVCLAREILELARNSRSEDPAERSARLSRYVSENFGLRPLIERLSEKNGN